MVKSISLNEIRSSCAEFVVQWRDAAGDERQEGQSFVRDLLMAFGISETRAAFYEKRVQRSSTGNQGYIDALIPGQLLIEMKSAGKNLGLAEIQAMDYIQNLEDAEVPRYVLTSDFKRFRLLDLHAPKGSDLVQFTLEQLPLQAESLAFLAGYQTRSFGSKEQEQASIKAAKLMADLYDALEGSGYGDHEASVFLVRTLFALYSDDAGVWQRDLFTEFVESRTAQDGSDLGPQLTMLFQVMNQPIEKRANTLDEVLTRFPYVNGGVFAEALPIPSFNKKMRDELLKACAFNWSAISPSIFGSLFQAVKSPEARRELGEHYTTETNILKTISPLFLDELHEQFELARNEVNALKKLRDEISKLRIFDPACGCGNFLVISYRELRAIELDILLRLQALGDTSFMPALYFEREDLAVTLDHIFGIEIEEWPARISQTALLLAEHQANMAMELALGKAPSSLPLEKVNGIRLGNALRTDWTEVITPSPNVMIVGNPPFVGQKEKSADQREDLKVVWGDQYDGYLDYVTGWLKKAADYFSNTPGGRFAFVSTNSITQGQPVAALFGPLFENGWRIKFAHQTFAWSSEAPGMAHVHCVIIGFSNAAQMQPRIFTYATPKSDPIEVPADSINAYLLDAPNVLVTKRMKALNAQLDSVNSGSKAVDWGFLTLEASPYDDVLAEVQSDPIAKQYLRRYVGGEELINSVERWCLWLKDAPPRDIASSRVLRTQVEEVQRLRNQSQRAGTLKAALTPHLFGEDRQPQNDYLAIPQTFSENRRYVTAERLSKNVIANMKLFTVEDPDGFAFGIVSSSMFITWQKTVGGRLKSDPSFSNTMVWNNLPLPTVTADQRDQIIQGGLGILEARALRPGLSLAEHYNPLAMDPALLKAHATLDKAVDKAFGAKTVLRSNSEREQILFERYLELTHL